MDWVLVDANRAIDSIQKELEQVAGDVITAVKDREISLLWTQGS